MTPRKESEAAQLVCPFRSMKLRCWPGALCLIGSGGEHAGKTIVVTRLDPHKNPISGLCWHYEGRPLPVFERGHHIGDYVSFADCILTPLTPPPGTQDTDTSQEILLWHIKRREEPVT